MKALVFDRPQTATIQDVEMPEIAADEVLVRSRNVGICHSDFELYEGRYIIPVSYSVIPGDEWCGLVVDTGWAVRGLHRGVSVVDACSRVSAGRGSLHFRINGSASGCFTCR